ncbi:hypothetical protein SCHPADRAFT_335349 [Schizopora paradoxa]|uniref:DH domain-containing protein n=1 Tax=Schizopora paradoxa TaxID=27342 RepID=A0A0H2RR17_9AGAM|nr:hypothetical protein SCHPADRAFT_335349 [Schizopora paradoxa]
MALFYSNILEAAIDHRRVISSWDQHLAQALRGIRDISELSRGFLAHLALITGFDDWCSSFLHRSVLSMHKLYIEYLELIPLSARCLSDEFRANPSYRSVFKSSQTAQMVELIFLPWKHLLFYVKILHELSEMDGSFREAVQAVQALHKQAAVRVFQSMAGFPEMARIPLSEFISIPEKDIKGQELVLKIIDHEARPSNHTSRLSDNIPSNDHVRLYRGAPGTPAPSYQII